MAEPISIQQLKDASEDAITLADFIYKPANVMIPRRLAEDINSLQYYLEYMKSFAQRSYETYDEMVTNASNLSENVSVFVTNDSDTSKNGIYTYNGTSFVKGEYQPENVAKEFVEAKLGGLQVFDGKVRAQDVSTDDGVTQEAKNTEFRTELDALPFEDGSLADTFVMRTTNSPDMIARNLRDVNSDRVNVHDFGAIGDGTLHPVSEWIPSRFSDLAEMQATLPEVTSLSDSIDRVAIQTAINYVSNKAAVTANRTGLGLVVGKSYVIDSDLALKNVSLDIAGSRLNIINNASLLVGVNTVLEGCSSAQILCEESYTGELIKKNPTLSSVGKLTTIGRLTVIRSGTLDGSIGKALNFTGLLSSVINLDVRNMADAVYCKPLSSSNQSYYNKINVRALRCGNAINLEGGDFQLCNGNTFWVSATIVDIGILITSTSITGASSNTFILSYIEQFKTAGITLDGTISFNTFIGGILEAGSEGTANPCILVKNGAKDNKFITSCSPRARQLALVQTDAGANTYELGKYGSWSNWSEDIGAGAVYSTASQDAPSYIGNTSLKAGLTHDLSSGSVISIGARHEDFIALTGVGEVTGVDGTVITSSRVTLVNNTLSNIVIKNRASATPAAMVLSGDVDTTLPKLGMITLVKVKGVSAFWVEESRSYSTTPVAPRQSGVTGARPTAPPVGFSYFDTTLGKPVFFKSTGVWVDSTGATV